MIPDYWTITVQGIENVMETDGEYSWPRCSECSKLNTSYQVSWMCVDCSWASIVPCSPAFDYPCGFTGDMGFGVRCSDGEGPFTLAFSFHIDDGFCSWEKTMEGFDCSTSVSFSGGDIKSVSPGLVCKFQNATVTLAPADGPC
jgi:hypothetical protein